MGRSELSEIKAAIAKRRETMAAILGFSEIKAAIEWVTVGEEGPVMR